MRIIHRTTVGIWPTFTEKGSFGGGSFYSYPPIAFAPNPVQCEWIGPLVSDLECTTCVIGYETNSTNDTTCIKPKFRPYRGWHSSAEKTALKLAENSAVLNASKPTLLTGHTCDYFEERFAASAVALPCWQKVLLQKRLPPCLALNTICIDTDAPINAERWRVMPAGCPEFPPHASGKRCKP